MRQKENVAGSSKSHNSKDSFIYKEYFKLLGCLELQMFK